MNCFFEDFDLYTTVKLVSAIKEDNRGYFIEVRIHKTAVTKFMENGITPLWSDDGYFYIPVQLNNKTILMLNGIRIYSFVDKKLTILPIARLTLKELALKRYSKKSHHRREVYATKVIIKITL